MFLEKIHNRPNQKWIDLEKMKKSEVPLVMYGAGINAVLCANLLREHSITINAVCVTEKNNIGETQIFDGMPVITLKDVENTIKNFDCLISFADITTAKQNLKRLSGVRNIFIIDNPGIVEDIDYSFLNKNKDEFNSTYNLLADRSSKDTFVDFLNIRISGEPEITGTKLQPPYFCDILPVSNDEVFVDCGAYDGDTIFSFLEKTSQHYDSIYAFEPDLNNYLKLKENIEARGIKDVKLFQKGVWNKRDILNFSSPVSPASHISENGGCQIEVDSIDNVVADGKATIIKMDIEGAELTALKGAQTVITRERSKLAVCVYHKADDLITIPPYLANLLPDFSFYLRRHSRFSLETVLYAIPNEKRKTFSI